MSNVKKHIMQPLQRHYHDINSLSELLFCRNLRSFLKVANKTNKTAILTSNPCLYNLKTINRLKKSPKIILLLCDPVLRSFSDYKRVFLEQNYKPVSERR